MADEPSIDEILASLDALLKEGEGRNDEPGEMVPPAGDEPSSPHRHDAPTTHFFETLDDEVEAGHAHAGAEAADVAGNRGEAGPGPTSQDVEAVGVDDGPHASRLYVLTDAMMIEDQPSLPLGMGEEPRAMDADEAMRQALAIPERTEPEVDEPEHVAEPGSGPLARTESGEPPMGEAVWAYGEEEPGAEPEPESEPEPEIVPEPELAYEPGGEAMQEYEEALAGTEAEPEPELEPEGVIARAPAWDADEVQALVDQVTDDVCSAMAEHLPEMIRMALAERLSAFIEARTEQQHTGNQE